jgi:hypothetical protein
MAKGICVYVWATRDISFDFSDGAELDRIDMVGLGHPWMVRNGCKDAHKLSYALVVHPGNTDFSESRPEPEFLYKTPFGRLPVCLACMQISGNRRAPFIRTTLSGAC